MSIEVRQKSVQKEERLWRWSVWIEGLDEELDEIEYVEYTLHPTFPRPIQRVANRRTKFRLSTSGWGEFKIYVEIKRKDGEVLKLEHWLTLEDPTTEKTRTASAKRERPAVLLSTGVVDMDFAGALREALNAQNVDVLMTDDFEPDQPLEASLDALIDRANAAVIIVSDKPSSWQMREIEAVQGRDMALTAVMIGPNATLPEPLSGILSISVKDVGDAPGVAREVAKRVKVV